MGVSHTTAIPVIGLSITLRSTRPTPFDGSYASGQYTLRVGKKSVPLQCQADRYGQVLHGQLPTNPPRA